MKTTVAIKEEQELNRRWFVVDATGQTLGRLAVRIANVLRGRNKAIWTPHVDCGDYVIVTNADKVKVTGKKETDKRYMFYTGWVGNEYYVNLSEFRERKPAFIIEHAVKGMLPRNKLSREVLKKLKVYGGDEHPHEAQQPEALTF
ncbi:MAG: 50S ribosomal protein L13 [Verrucomicrobiota bacterium]